MVKTFSLPQCASLHHDANLSMGAPCPTSLGKVLLQFFNHLLRLRKFELSWRALLYTSPEFSTWEGSDKAKS